MSNLCVICSGHMNVLGCEECGKLIFQDDIKLIVENQRLSARIYVTNKKIYISRIDWKSYKIPFKQMFRSAILDQLGILGRSIDPNNHKEYPDSYILDIKKVKNHKISSENYIEINENRKVVVDIENEENRQKLIKLMQ